MQKSLQVLIADSQQIFAQSIKYYLKHAVREVASVPIDNITVVKNGAEAIRQTELYAYDVTILDLNLPIVDGMEAIGKIKDIRDTKVLVLSQYTDSMFTKKSFLQGADGYMFKSQSIEDLPGVLEEILEGGRYLPMNNSLFGAKKAQKNNHLRFKDYYHAKNTLTPREKEVLSLLQKSMTSKEIAAELFISTDTVGVHRKNLMRKLGVSSREELIEVITEMA